MAGKNKRRVPLKDKQKIQEGRNEFQNVKRYVERYIGSPGFNERFNRKLKQLNAGTLFNPWSFAINPNYVNKTVLNLWEDNGSSGITRNNVLNMTKAGLWRHSIPHEMGHLIDNGIISIYKNSPSFPNLFRKEEIHYSTLYPELRRNKEGKEAIKNGIRPDSYMPKDQYYNTYIKNKAKYHDGFEQEPYADFFQMRYELDKLNLYDSTRANNPFTKEVLNKFRKITNSGKGINGKYPYTLAIKRIFDKFTDDQIIKIMNTVAETDPSKQLNDQTTLDPNQTYYAKKGTRLIKKPKNND